jgi:RNA polymerase-binding transcription factor DksA
MREPNHRYSDAELEEFRVHIQQKIDEAQADLAKTRSQIDDMNENGFNQQGGDWYDDTNNHIDMEVLEHLSKRQVELMRHLGNALLRIQNKTYGVCFVTGKLIDKRRLLLVPHTTKSVEGKNLDKIASVTPPDIQTRLAQEGAPKQPRPHKPIHPRSNSHQQNDSGDWAEPSAENLEDTSFQQKSEDE